MSLEVGEPWEGLVAELTSIGCVLGYSDREGDLSGISWIARWRGGCWATPWRREVIRGVRRTQRTTTSCTRARRTTWKKQQKEPLITRRMKNNTWRLENSLPDGITIDDPVISPLIWYTFRCLTSRDWSYNHFRYFVFDWLTQNISRKLEKRVLCFHFTPLSIIISQVAYFPTWILTCHLM